MSVQHSGLLCFCFLGLYVFLIQDCFHFLAVFFDSGLSADFFCPVFFVSAMVLDWDGFFLFGSTYLCHSSYSSFSPRTSLYSFSFHLFKVFFSFLCLLMTCRPLLCPLQILTRLVFALAHVSTLRKRNTLICAHSCVSSVCSLRCPSHATLILPVLCVLSESVFVISRKLYIFEKTKYHADPFYCFYSFYSRFLFLFSSFFQVCTALRSCFFV